MQTHFFAAAAAAACAAALNPTYDVPAQALANWIVQCQYQQLPEVFSNPGVFNNELLWESGNTIEALSNLAAVEGKTSSLDALLNNTFLRTSPVVDNCFDDHQWWLLGWISAYELNGNPLFLQRAAQAFDYIVNVGWDDVVCGGGVTWCPLTSGQTAYKNAITTELFLTAAARMNVHASALPAAPGYYLNWGLKAWRWLEGSGMINDQGLINDGLSIVGNPANGQCVNNKGTPWSYNQGVLLDGLALLSQATGNSSLVQVAMGLANSSMAALVNAQGVLVESCGSTCDNDAHIFKGVYARHLGKLAASTAVPAAFTSAVGAWMGTNAASILSQDACSTGGYGLLWQGPCIAGNDTATSTAALDALTAAAYLTTSAQDSEFTPVGLGACVDGSGQGMPSCTAMGAITTQAQCEAAAAADPRSQAFDFLTKCDGTTVCRVFTSASSCGRGWTWAQGGATTVTASNSAHLTICVRKA